MSTSRLSIFDIPEVIDSLGGHLDPHSLSICLQVNKTWYHDFLPQLWREVVVYDFDYNHIEFCPLFDESLPKLSQCRQSVQENENEDLEYGHHHAHKFSHWTRSFTTASIKSLIDLGEQCVHLERIALDGWGARDDQYRVIPDSNSSLWCWNYEYFGPFSDQFLRTWIELLGRNPRLKYVRIELMTTHDKDVTELVEALGRLQGLEELELWSQFCKVELPMGVQRLIMEKCLALKKLTLNKQVVLPVQVKERLQKG